MGCYDCDTESCLKKLLDGLRTIGWPKGRKLRHCLVGEDGTDIKVRMELTRHKTPAMTMRYSHLSVKYKKQAIDEVPSFGPKWIHSKFHNRPMKNKSRNFRE